MSPPRLGSIDGKAALARRLSALEADPRSALAAEMLDAALTEARGAIVGLTGPPGVGKSSLMDALIPAVRGADRTIAILAVDPSSARTGGALLGDRTRLSHDPDDAGVFVRSMAAGRSLGGLADVAFPAALLMAQASDLVLLETVGVGQSETDVRGVADAVALLLQPGSGDALQFMKAGVMETPDVAIVTKGDLGASARRAAADAAAALSLGESAPPPVHIVAARPTMGARTGVSDALDALRAAADDGRANRPARAEAWCRRALDLSAGRIFSAVAERHWRAERPASAGPFDALRRAEAHLRDVAAGLA